MPYPKPTQYRVSLDELFEDNDLWNALNKGSNSGHHIEIEGFTKEQAIRRILNRITPELQKLLEKYIEEVPSDEDET